MGSTWGPTGIHRSQVDPMSATWSLLSGNLIGSDSDTQRLDSSGVFVITIPTSEETFSTRRPCEAYTSQHLEHHSLRKWLVACSVQNYYLSKCCHPVHWTVVTNLSDIWIKNISFIPENAVHLKMSAKWLPFSGTGCMLSSHYYSISFKYRSPKWSWYVPATLWPS